MVLRSKEILPLIPGTQILVWSSVEVYNKPNPTPQPQADYVIINYVFSILPALVVFVVFGREGPTVEHKQGLNPVLPEQADSLEAELDVPVEEGLYII